MRRRIASVLFSVLFLSLATTKTFAYDLAPTPAPLPVTDIREIRLERWGCREFCPSYTLIFRSDGSATFIGMFFVPRVGRYSGRVDFPRVAAWLESEHIDRFANGYGLGWLDADGGQLTVIRKDSTKVIRTANTDFLPVEVTGIMSALDGFANRIQWRPDSAIDSYLGRFLDQSKTDVLTEFDVSPDINGDENKADGSILILRRGDCIHMEELQVSVRKLESHFAVMEDRLVPAPCSFPCGVPFKDLKATVGA
jgi:hypothetical protein